MHKSIRKWVNMTPFKRLRQRETLIRNRGEFLELAKNPEFLDNCLKRLQLDCSSDEVSISRADRAHAINIHVPSNSFGTLNKLTNFDTSKFSRGGLSTRLRYNVDGKPQFIFVNIIVNPSSIKHEEEHAETRVIRGYQNYESPSHLGNQKAVLFDELISFLAELPTGNLLKSEHFKHHLNYIVDDFINADKYSKSLNGNEIKQFREGLNSFLESALHSVNSALNEMPNGEVMRVLQDSDIDNFEENLKARIKVTRKFRKKKKP